MFSEAPLNRSALFLLTAVLLFSFVSSVCSQQNSEGDAGKAAVENVLRVQQEAWNRHDLDGFMAGYWKSAELTFFSGAKQTGGWQATLDRYKLTYASPGHEMGKLEFSGLRIEMLGAAAAFVRGAWGLTMSDGKNSAWAVYAGVSKVS